MRGPVNLDWRKARTIPRSMVFLSERRKRAKVDPATGEPSRQRMTRAWTENVAVTRTGEKGQWSRKEDLGEERREGEREKRRGDW